MRGIARSLRLFGFDVDGLPGGAYRDLGEPESIRRVPGESLDDEIARLSRALLASDLSDMHLLDRTSLETLRDSLHYISLAYPAPSYEALAPAMAFRERVMRRHVDVMLSQLPKDHGLVLWGCRASCNPRERA